MSRREDAVVAAAAAAAADAAATIIVTTIFTAAADIGTAEAKGREAWPPKDALRGKGTVFCRSGLAGSASTASPPPTQHNR